MLNICIYVSLAIILCFKETVFRLCSNNPEENEWSLLCKTMGSIIDQNEQTKKYENPFHDFFYQELDMINSLSIKVIKLCFSLSNNLN